MDDEPFVLQRISEKSPEFRPSCEAAGDKYVQRRLFSGLDCLPGQRDLFDDLDKREFADEAQRQ